MSPDLFRRAALVAACLLAPASHAAPVQTEHVEAELIAERLAFAPGETNWIALRLRPDPGWHVYWRNPGDSGIATKLNWSLPPGITAGEIHWPYPHPESLGDLTNYGYDSETLHLVPVTLDAKWPAARKVELKAEAKWLVCSDVCIPGSAQLSLELPVAAKPQPDADWAELFARTRAMLPVPAPGWTAKFAVDGADFSLAIAGAESADFAQARAIEFFPIANDLVNHAAPQRIVMQGDGLRLSQSLSNYFVDAPAAVAGVLVVHGANSAQAFELSAAPGAVQAVAGPPLPAKTEVAVVPAPTAAPIPAEPPAPPGLLLVLALALAGGLILNLMPCVFPVLSLKALAVMQSRAQDHAYHRRHALAYTAGVVLSCVAVAALLIGLRAGGEAIGWGFQLQSPVFVGLLVYLLFAMALSLSGAVEFGAGVMGVGQSLTQAGGYAGSFFTGVLATVVASPCTAPFMGTALGYAMTQPAPVALLVFAALGLGLALPFLLLGFFPRLASALPRPGAWMQTFKQAMAFPLYLSVVWLLWVVSRQSSPNASALVMLGLVLVAFALWLWPRAGWTARALRFAAIITALTLLASPLMDVPQGPAEPQAPPAQLDWEPWSEARVAQLRAEHRTIFVDFTADWCLTCKVNERVTLNTERVREAFRRHDVAFLVADWTRADPAITRVLASFGRSGVPLYLVYPQGQEPRVLPQILTPATILDAIQPQPGDSP